MGKSGGGHGFPGGFMVLEEGTSAKTFLTRGDLRQMDAHGSRYPAWTQTRLWNDDQHHQRGNRMPWRRPANKSKPGRQDRFLPAIRNSPGDDGRPRLRLRRHETLLGQWPDINARRNHRPTSTRAGPRRRTNNYMNLTKTNILRTWQSKCLSIALLAYILISAIAATQG